MTNKAQLIEALSERLGDDKKVAAQAVDGLVDIIIRTVNKGEKVNITGFGVFEKRARAARTARNPRTGEAVKVKKTNVPAFRAGTTFKDVIGGAKKLPKVPTLRELDINFFAAPWMGLQAPKGMPPTLVNRMNEAVAEVFADPDVVARLAAANTDVRTGSPQEMDRRIAADTALWAPVIQKYGIKSE